MINFSKYICLILINLMFFLLGMDYDSLSYELYVFMSIVGIGLLCFSKATCQIKYLPKQTKTFLLLLIIFAGYVFLRVLVNKPVNLFEFRFETINVMLLSPFFTIYCYYTINQFEHEHKIFETILITISLSCLIFFIILMVNYDGTRSVGGIIHTPIDQGNKGMLLGLILIPILLTNTSIKYKILALIGIISGISISIISQSRGGWLALIIVFLSILFFLYRFDEKRKLTIFLSLFALLVITIIILMPFHHVDERIIQAYHNIIAYFNNSNPNTSIGYRFQLWENSLQSTTENFWLGLGWDNSNHLYYTEDGFNHGHSHNQFLFIFVELGLIGFLSYLAPFLYIVYLCYKKIMQQNSFSNIFTPILMSILIMIEAIMEFNLSHDTGSLKSFMMIFITLTLIALTICFKEQKIKIHE